MEIEQAINEMVRSAMNTVAIGAILAIALALAVCIVRGIIETRFHNETFNRNNRY